MTFNGRTVVITGATGGIGSTLTRGFLSRGARVFATGRKQKQLENLKDELGRHANLFTAAFDVSNEAGRRDFSSRVRKEWGAVDALVNCAGHFPFTAFEKISYAEWRKICAINLDGPFLVTKNLLPLLKQSLSGRIINISSGSIYVGNPDQCHYVAAKAGLIGLTRSLAKVVGQYGITVNAVTPGLTVTTPVRKHFSKEMLAKVAQMRALKRDETAEDLVGAVCFLASPDAAFITGQIINVDGGSSFH